jgi:hypothetical protein
MTELEKSIYNKYLAVSRGQQKLPFKLRKDFSDFEENENYVYVKKLGIFFNKFKHIDMDEFFLAPYCIYESGEYFDLSFYVTPRALKVYTIFQTKKMEEPPDSKNQLAFIQSSLKFILAFCGDKNIELGDYISYKTDITNDFLIHLKERKISIFVIFGLPGAEKILYGLSDDLRQMMFKNIFERIDTFRTRFAASSKAKILVREGLKKLQNLTEK